MNLVYSGKRERVLVTVSYCAIGGSSNSLSSFAISGKYDSYFQYLYQTQEQIVLAERLLYKNGYRKVAYI